MIERMRRKTPIEKLRRLSERLGRRVEIYAKRGVACGYFEATGGS